MRILLLSFEKNDRAEKLDFKEYQLKVMINKIYKDHSKNKKIWSATQYIPPPIPVWRIPQPLRLIAAYLFDF